MSGRGNKFGGMENSGMNRGEGMGHSAGMDHSAGMGHSAGMDHGTGMNHGQNMGGFGMGHQEPMRREESMRREEHVQHREPMQHEMPRHEGHFFDGDMRREPFPTHHEERPRPHHSLPFGLIAAANVIWNQLHYQRIHRILQKMYYNEQITRAEEDVLYESFGRYIRYEEVPELLDWVEKEQRYF